MMVITIYVVRIFKCGRNYAYNIMHSVRFPLCVVGGKFYVERSEFEFWLAHTKNVKFKK